MFQSARIRLTAWYLLIIAFITLSFSAVIYRFVSLELERGFIAAEYRLRGLPIPQRNVRLLLADELVESKKSFLVRLIIVNTAIISGAGVAGYFLAGKTLKPIKLIMDEQKRFVADSSHELRTPLTAMKSEIEVALREKGLTIKYAKEVLKSNLDEVDKMKELNDYLLSLSRYEASGRELPKEKVDLKEVALQAIGRNMALTKEKKITIKKELEGVTVRGNPQSLVELASILINNAIKYSNSGGKITVKTKIKKRLTGEKFLRNKIAIIEVKDVGIGINEGEIPHIFDRFYRADTSRCKSEVDGYGLGLSIAKSIVDIHNGDIKVKSKVGKGSTFTILLPA